jgi:hypothetical protein
MNYPAAEQQGIYKGIERRKRRGIQPEEIKNSGRDGTRVVLYLRHPIFHDQGRYQPSKPKG